jgi:DNA-binding MarR family transcriptional regulator
MSHLNRLDFLFEFSHPVDVGDVAGSPGCRSGECRRNGNMNYEVKQNDVIGAEALYRLSDYLPYRLTLLASSLNNAFEIVLDKEHQLGLTDWRVIATLGEFGSLTARDICERGRMHKTKVSRAVASLEMRRLLQRRTNRQDMREAFLSLTELGRTVFRQVVPAAVAFSHKITDQLSSEELLCMESVVERLIAATGDEDFFDTAG